MMNQENEFLEWGDSFIAEESNFKLFQPGEYPFIVKKMERKIYDGQSTKIPNGAPYAEITMEFSGPEGTTLVTDRLYLMRSWQWKLTQFFSGIGQAPVVGQPFTPNWGAVIGSQGRAKLEINTYMSKGSERKNNQVKEYLEHQGQVQQFQQPTQNFNQSQNYQDPNQPNRNEPAF